MKQLSKEQKKNAGKKVNKPLKDGCIKTVKPSVSGAV